MAGDWQVYWQPGPFESDNAGPSPGLSSSRLDNTHDASVQDMQPQLNFDDFDYEELDFASAGPIFDDIINMGEHETELPTVPAGSLEQQQDETMAGQAVAPRRPRKPRTRGPSAVQWNAKKSVIQDLYMVQDKTLKETMDIMKETHDFAAT